MRIGIQVAEALEYANRQGILHRDVKPSNLLLDNHGNVWVADFGLAKTAEADDLTHTGDILGTIRYMAPERFSGQCDARSDVYSLGLTLYELVALKPAYEASDRHRLMERVLHEEPERMRKLAPGVPRDLETIIAKAIAHEPAARYASAAALAEDLRRFVEDRPIRARRVSPAERLARWCRRNKLLAGSFAAAAAGLLAAAALSLLYARRQALHAAEQVAATRRITGLASDLQASISQLKAVAGELKTSLAVSDRRRLDLTYDRARTNFERGQFACERGEIGPGLLYFIESWRSAVEAGDPGLRMRPAPAYPAGGTRPPGSCGNFPGTATTLPSAPTVRLWHSTYRARRSSSTNRLPATPIGPPMEHPDSVSSMDFSPDSKILLTGCADKMARLWNAATGRPVGSPMAHQAAVKGVAFGLDGRTVFTASNDRTVHLWDAATGTPISRPITHQGYLYDLAVSPDRKTMLAAGPKGRRCWTSPPATRPASSSCRPERFLPVFSVPTGRRC